MSDLSQIADLMARSQAGQENRRSQLSRVQSLGVALTTVVGRIDVRGVGELIKPIQFSVNFLEKPTVTYGAEMQGNAGYVTGSLPTYSAIVMRWVENDLGQNRRYVVGADIGIVVGGELAGAEQEDVSSGLLIHWTAVGKAFRNPIGADGG